MRIKGLKQVKISPSAHAVRLGKGWSPHLSSQLGDVASVLGYAAHKWANIVTKVHIQAHTISL